VSATLQNLARDLAFLRQAVDRTARMPPAIYFLWAVIVGVGGVVVEQRTWAVWYWLGASVVGLLASAYLGWRHGVRMGAVSRERGVRAVLHWGGIVAAVFAATALVWRGQLAVEAVSGVALLLVSLGYYLMGVHEDRWSYVPAVLALGAAVSVTMIPGSWAVAGVACAAGLALMGVLEWTRERRRHV